MYVPRHFAASAEDVEQLLRDHGAADLITPTADGLEASFLPFVYDGTSLKGHVARNNPHWRAKPSGESLVIVRGPDAYVSPSFYPSKAEHGRVVPTWNYVTAHVHGALVIHDDAAWVAGLVRRLTAKHEDGAELPWTVDDAPARFIEGQLRAIVGVELIISRIEAKLKLSQNRPEADVDGVIAGLRDRGDEASARAVDDARVVDAARVVDDAR